jgi:hypothetical protein
MLPTQKPGFPDAKIFPGACGGTAHAEFVAVVKIDTAKSVATIFFTPSSPRVVLRFSRLCFSHRMASGKMAIQEF